MKKADFYGLQLADPGIEGLVTWLVAEPRGAFRVAAYLNAHTFNLATDGGSPLPELYRRMDVLYPDGMAVVWAARREGFPVSERVSAGDFFLPFCEAAAASGRRLALVGGPPGLAEGCASALSARVPGLQIVLTTDGFRTDVDALRSVLIAAAPDIVLLGMGTPRQEALALSLREVQCTVWCVGALFEYYTPGVRAHAPAWMRRNGLEWAFRLALEPRRLARRYLIGNIVFVWRVLTRRRAGP